MHGRLQATLPGRVVYSHGLYGIDKQLSGAHKVTPVISLLAVSIDDQHAALIPVGFYKPRD